MNWPDDLDILEDASPEFRRRNAHLFGDAETGGRVAKRSPVSCAQGSAAPPPRAPEPAAGDSWTLTYWERPKTLNGERSEHWRAHRGWTAEWREAFAALAAEAKIPHLERVAVIATPYYRHRGSIPDVGACFPSAKAAIDGLVDAGVLDDDDPTHLVRLTFDAPIIDGEPDRLVIRITVQPPALADNQGDRKA